MDERLLGPQIGEGADADIFAFGDDVLKLFRADRPKEPAFIEALNMAVAASHGLPVPDVIQAGRFAGRWGLVMSRIDGGTLGAQAEADPAAGAGMLDEMVRLQVTMHGLLEPRLRPLKPKLAAAINCAPQLGDAHKARLIAGLAAMADGQALCHGDFHPYNLIGKLGRTSIIDWLDATSGPPAADACRTHVILTLVGEGLAGDYIARYANRSGLSGEAILAWRPFIAAARLRENPPGTEGLLAMAGDI